MVSSLLFELITFFGAAVTIVAIGLKIGRLLQKIDTAIGDIESIKKDIRDIKDRLGGMDKRLTLLEKGK
ncbi:hypothetical protein [Candidatus Methanoperedens nitratireducens]|uniref:Uncharacterized protein n=1 Tax=Candidatus Methanoperedens nitratireducens TaxID=1392998 RepID=A0A284VNT4_9EURY|nr:hypothetical protein [Candidatus Methanoperedens nitroreducens]SNQ60873.1 hypothetical protein MNV_2060015 [Candidatus Methanoperedens nitroreducens]